MMETPKADKTGIRPGVIVAIAAVLAVLIAAKLLGWIGPKPSRTENIPSAGDAATAPRGGTPSATIAGRAAATDLPIGVPRPIARATGQPAIPGAGSIGATGSTPVVSGLPDPAGDWSVKLDEILGSNDDEAKKADQLLGMWKTLPEEGQVEIMQHISNLLPDEKFPALAQAFTNASTPEAVLEVIMTDTLNRPNGIKLPVLLDVARTPGHPKAEEARDILEVFVDADHGTDWVKWEKAVKDWLKENPDEPEIKN